MPEPRIELRFSQFSQGHPLHTLTTDYLVFVERRRFSPQDTGWVLRITDEEGNPLYLSLMLNTSERRGIPSDWHHDFPLVAGSWGVAVTEVERFFRAIGFDLGEVHSDNPDLRVFSLREAV